AAAGVGPVADRSAARSLGADGRAVPACAGRLAQRASRWPRADDAGANAVGASHRRGQAAGRPAPRPRPAAPGGEALNRAPGPPNSDTAIAVIGMAVRFPDAPDVGRFWENLAAGVESIAIEAAHDGQVAAAATVEGIELFDAAFFGYTRGEAAELDPQQRI